MLYSKFATNFTLVLKKNEFLRFFEICYTMQNKDKDNKIAKTGLKTKLVFYSLKLALISFRTRSKCLKNANKPSHDCICLRLKRRFN